MHPPSPYLLPLPSILHSCCLPPNSSCLLAHFICCIVTYKLYKTLLAYRRIPHQCVCHFHCCYYSSILIFNLFNFISLIVTALQDHFFPTNFWERPYQHDSTASRLLSEVKHVRAWLVLRWGTTLESQVLFSFSVTNLALFCPSACYWPTNCGSLNLELYSLPPAFLFLALFYSRGLPMR